MAEQDEGYQPRSPGGTNQGIEEENTGEPFVLLGFISSPSVSEYRLGGH